MFVGDEWMADLAPNPGFDWSKVTWGRPDSVVSVLCSYCSASIGEDDIPLRMWDDKGFSAQFCERCQEEWWGLANLDAPRSH